MAASADSIGDIGLLRHGGMGRLLIGRYAPSTFGSFLRCFAFGHVRQLDAVAAGLVANLAVRAPVLPGTGDRRDPAAKGARRTPSAVPPPA